MSSRSALEENYIEIPSPGAGHGSDNMPLPGLRYCQGYQGIPLNHSSRKTRLLTDLASPSPMKTSQQHGLYSGIVRPGGNLTPPAVACSRDSLQSQGSTIPSSPAINCLKSASHAPCVGKFTSSQLSRKPGTGVYMPGLPIHSLNQGKNPSLPSTPSSIQSTRSAAILSPLSPPRKPRSSPGGSVSSGGTTPGRANQVPQFQPPSGVSSPKQPVRACIYRCKGTHQCQPGFPHQEVPTDLCSLSPHCPLVPIHGPQNHQCLSSPKVNTQDWTHVDGGVGSFISVQDGIGRNGCSWMMPTWSAGTCSPGAGILAREAWIGVNLQASPSSMVMEPFSGSEDQGLSCTWPLLMYSDATARERQTLTSSHSSRPSRSGPACPDPTVSFVELASALWTQQQQQSGSTGTVDLGAMLYESMEMTIRMQNYKADVTGSGPWHVGSAKSCTGATSSKPGQPVSPKSPLDEAVESMQDILQQQSHIRAPAELTTAAMLLPSEDELGAGWS